MQYEEIKKKEIGFQSLEVMKVFKLYNFTVTFYFRIVQSKDFFM